MPLLGAHLSISGGFRNVKQQCNYLECGTFQIFTKNQRRWHAPEINEEDLYLFKRFLIESKISTFVVHSSYLINIASFDDEIRDRSVIALADELKRAEKLGASVFVLHPGSPKRPDSPGSAIKRAVSSLCISIEKAGIEKVRIAVENTSGAGYLLGKNLHELLAIMEGVRICGAVVGVCIDTAHAFQSGYVLDKRFIDEIYALFGESIYVFHVNDSLTERGSKRDRHTNIGKGYIPVHFFSELLKDRKFQKIPFILETPGGLRKFKEDIETLRRMLYG